MSVSTFLRGAAAAALTLAALAPACAADDTLYRELGGKDGIHRIISTFTPMVLADARIKDSFADSDMKHVGARLEEQICALAGGPCTYGGEPMKESHGGLKVTNAQFNALTENLQIAMEKNGVTNAAANRLVAMLAPMQREIVTK